MAPEPRYSVSNLPGRIAARIRINSITGCWEWTARPMEREREYGQVRMGNRVLGAHRVVFELLVGPIPKGLQLDHLCRVTYCVNPAHLEVVTGRQNVHRGNGVLILDHPRCMNGHLLAADRPASTSCPTCRDLNRPANTLPTADSATDRTFAVHVLATLGDEVRLHSTVICERLCATWPGLYAGWDPAFLAAQLRRLNIRTRQICIRHPDGSATNRRGVYRADLLLAIGETDAA